MEIAPELANLLYTLAITLGVAGIAEIIKTKLFKGLDKWGVRLAVVAVALVIALIQIGWQFLPVQYASAIITIFAGATTWYKLLSSAFEKQDG
jgi:hypothetical protein